MATRRLKVKLSKPVCSNCMCEDEIRNLVDSLYVDVDDSDERQTVTSNGGVQVEFDFGANGFEGLSYKVKNKSIPIIGGDLSTDRALRVGPISATNPGCGWEVDEEFTAALLPNQGVGQSDIQFFVVKRVNALDEEITNEDNTDV